ncbi:hypothetical protein DM860_004079 [Cuscuta australis]|uniref:U1-type domain-containing protein n=1 Tax=Cuscuta australis TaxID=267555 RepID=A0A328CV39_9ASTE|nr:hypothetical protein DM860_004079 [Cuscuta australis]
MSKTLLQPVGQKRLTNVAVVRLKKHGNRFEIACYKNKVLSWRSGVEKDVDEVLQSHTVYSNVSKGVLAKSKDLIAAFGTDDPEKVCMEILEKGELQVAGKERDSQLSSQFKDIATIVMQKTINPETKYPYTISMIERLMHEIHFAVDPHSSSKKQALDVIHELQKHYPIKRAPMRLRLTIPVHHSTSISDKLKDWNVGVISREEAGSHLSILCEIEPHFFRDCDALVRNSQGRLEIIATNIHVEGNTFVDHFDDHEDEPPSLSEKMQKQTISSETENPKGERKVNNPAKSGGLEGETKQNKCSTCNAVMGDPKEYREHFKSEWHKHNLRRKTKQLPPLTAEECMSDVALHDSKADLKEYSF